MNKEELNTLTGNIIDCCFAVHKIMGPGLLESIYVCCLIKEFELRGIKYRKEVLIPLLYKGFELIKDFKLDLLVEEAVILEIKSVEQMHPVFEAQIISYLKLTDKKVGFLINFNVPLVKDGIKRFVNNF